MLSNWLGWLRRLDWRFVAGVLSVLAVTIGFVWYGGFRPGISTSSLIVGVVVASAALVAVLLSISKSLWNLVGYVGLVVVFGALFVRSQLRRGAFAPPVEEWTIVVGLIGGLIALALMIIRSRSSDGGGPPAASRVISTVLTVFVLGASCLCLPVAKFIADDSSGAGSNGGLLHSGPIRAELLPLPAETELVPTESFKVGGEDQHVFVIASTATITREKLVELIRTHYIDQDWPLEPRQFGLRRVYYGCRPVRGLLTWNPHCLEVTIDEGTDDRPGYPAIPGTVNVYVQ